VPGSTALQVVVVEVSNVATNPIVENEEEVVSRRRN
jgi:hypothetical protein